MSLLISSKMRDELSYVIIQIARSILSLHFKQFHQTLYSDSFCIADMKCLWHFGIKLHLYKNVTIS